jgi:para-nitrobenzyl esterase
LVSTIYGDVLGFEDVLDTLAWKGIPYAAPPLGELRWTAPQDPESWSGVRDATNDPVECVQMGPGPLPYLPGEVVGSEDCLYLNVWRPAGDATNLPVYFWIHGGSNNTGSAQAYQGPALAAWTNVVVVVIQYRLGPFGWLTHPALRPASDNHPKNHSGNYGTLDHLMALKWVRDNIEAFGGDPHNITIAGESAGGHNVMNLMISPLAKQRFHKVIMQSGGMMTSTLEEGDQFTNGTLLNLLVADGSAADEAEAQAILGGMSDNQIRSYLRGKPAEAVLLARFVDGSLPSHSAYEDGTVIPFGGLIPAIESGEYRQVPIILGSNRDEMKFFQPLYPVPISTGGTWQDLWAVLYPPNIPLDWLLPDPVDKALYQGVAEFGSLNWRYNFVDAVARPLREQQDDVYAYLFEWDGVEGSSYDFIFGAAHATEIPFFFGGPTDIFGGIAFDYPDFDTVGRQALSQAMMAYVAGFVRTGNPNGPGLPPWAPTWAAWSNDEEEPKVIVLDATADYPVIHMIDEEITAEVVQDVFWAIYSSLPEWARQILWLFVWY